MKKKIVIGVGALLTAVVLSPLFAAFEAHVINVTAKIENALSVNTNALDFGTVFPQEHLDLPVKIALSQSFLDEDRVDDVEYFIRQKPKCAITWNDGQSFDPEHTATGHVVVGDNPATLGVIETYWIDCGKPPRELNTQPLETWGVLPSLCEYISKEGEDRNDEDTPSFHHPWQIVNDAIQWLDTHGRLARSDEDPSDEWTIDLAVPCFGNFCAQDWEAFVHGINPDANPDDYTQPIANEHKIFGCDLWVEVSGVSRPPGTLIINKVVIPTGSPSAFSFTVDSGASTAFDADGSNSVGASAGAHVVAEVPAAGYTTVISGPDCDASGNVTVPSAGSATCTITNTLINPQLPG